VVPGERRHPKHLGTAPHRVASEMQELAERLAGDSLDLHVRGRAIDQGWSDSPGGLSVAPRGALMKRRRRYPPARRRMLHSKCAEAS
jgi:hypothetical protein